MSIPATRPSQANSTLVLVLGILSVLVLPVLGPIAWIMGNSALRTIAQAGGESQEKQNSLIGRNCGIVGSVLLCVLAVYLTVTLIIAGRMLSMVSSMTSDGSSITTSHSGALKPANSPHDLGLAIVENDVPAVKSFLVNGPSLANKKDNVGETPLFDAAFFGDKAIVELLMDNGAQVNVHDDFGQTPLDKAKAGHHPDVIAYLESHGAKSGT